MCRESKSKRINGGSDEWRPNGNAALKMAYASAWEREMNQDDENWWIQLIRF